MDSFFGYSLDDFREEARELLNKAEGIIDRIQVNPEDHEGINGLFRTIHSLKGSAGYVGIPEVNDFAHLYESFLGDLRSNKYELSKDVLNILVRARDYLDDIIFNADSTASLEIDDSIADNLERIVAALKNRSSSSPASRGLDAGGLQVDTSDGIDSVDSGGDSHLGVSTPEEIVFEGDATEDVVTEVVEEAAVAEEVVTEEEVPAPPVAAKEEVVEQVTEEQPIKEQPITEEAEPDIVAEHEINFDDDEEKETTPIEPSPPVTESDISASTIEEPSVPESTPVPVVAEEIETPNEEPEVPANATEMSEDEVIRVTIIKSINDLYDSLKVMPVDMEKLEKSVKRLDDIVGWAFGDDAHAISVPLEEMRVIVESSEMTEATVANLKKGFNMLVPAIKAQLATLTDEEEAEPQEVEQSVEESVEEVKEDSNHMVGELTEEAEKLISASRDEIIKITADRDLEEFIKLIEEDPLDIGALSQAIERLSDLNKWAFNENENVVDSINVMTSLFTRSTDPNAIKEIRTRGESLKSTLLNLFGEKAKEKESSFQSGASTATGLDLNAGGSRQARSPRAKVQKTAVSTMKVSSGDLEDLIDNVSKLKGINQRDFEALQQSTLQLRMVPVGEVFSRFRKITRDLSEDLGKNIGIEITGEEVRLDKVLADKLNEPLLHLVRNAASHGIESNEVREAAGKGPAIIGINAFQEGGSIVIEITDNGGGIDVERVKEKGLKLGLINQANVDDMKDKEILDLIFAPGFSTKEGADKVSGRGVGMDVVKEIVSSMQGVVTLKTKKSVGTSFRLQLPLTLAIIKAMVLDQSGKKIAVPAASIERIETMTENEIHAGAVVDKGKVSLFLQEEGEVVPLINFTELFGGEVVEGKRCVVLLKSGAGEKVVIVVDEALGRQSLTVKPLDVFSETPYFSSASVVDNDIVLILNVPSLMSA